MNDIDKSSSLPRLLNAANKPLLPSEYMIVLEPHEELQERITKIRQSVGAQLEVEASKGKSHICLVRFLQYEMKEHHLYNRIRLLAMALPPFKVELDGFGSFPTHSIFIRVQTQEPVKAICKKLRLAQSLMTINKENKPHFLNEPNINIARRLLPWQYEKAWALYQQQYFHGRFVADHLVFLKRPAGSRAWQVADRFGLMNMPVETRQGDLFG